MVILELIHAENPDSGRGVFIRLKTNALRGSLVIHDTSRIARPCAGDGSFKFLPYQLSTAGSWPAVVTTGNGGLGLDPGEGA